MGKAKKKRCWCQLSWLLTTCWTITNLMHCDFSLPWWYTFVEKTLIQWSLQEWSSCPSMCVYCHQSFKPSAQGWLIPQHNYRKPHALLGWHPKARWDVFRHLQWQDHLELSKLILSFIPHKNFNFTIYCKILFCAIWYWKFTKASEMDRHRKPQKYMGKMLTYYSIELLSTEFVNAKSK